MAYCKNCGGTGYREDYSVCPACKGTGKDQPLLDTTLQDAVRAEKVRIDARNAAQRAERDAKRKSSNSIGK